MSALLFILIGALPVAAIIAAIVIFRRPPAGAISSTPADGATSVPLAASFTSMKGAGPFGGSHNNLNPLLMLGEDSIEYRVLRRKTVPYAEIDEVDGSFGPRTASIVISFADSNFVFTGHMRDRRALADALRMFQDKGCRLSPEAEALAEAPTA